MDYDNFIYSLEQIPWFSNIGKPISNAKIKRINSWDDWPGPEKREIECLHLRQQKIYDQLVADHDEKLNKIWKDIIEKVISVSSKFVPFDPEEDAWHAPTMSVWQAAWTAGIVGICLYKNVQIPAEIEDQWHWYSIGHWPCGYDRIDADDGPVGLVIY